MPRPRSVAPDSYCVSVYLRSSSQISGIQSTLVFVATPPFNLVHNGEIGLLHLRGWVQFLIVYLRRFAKTRIAMELMLPIRGKHYFGFFCYFLRSIEEHCKSRHIHVDLYHQTLSPSSTHNHPLGASFFFWLLNLIVFLCSAYSFHFIRWFDACRWKPSYRTQRHEGCWSCSKVSFSLL